MTELLLKLTISVWPFGQLLSLRVGQSNQVIYLLDILVALLTLSLIIPKKTRRQILIDKISPYLLFFVAAGALSLLVNLYRLDTAQTVKALFYFLRLLVYPSLYFAVKSIDFKRIKPSLVSSVIIFIGLSISQYIFFPDATDLKMLGFDDHYYRLIGSLFDPNYTGEILVMIGLFAIATNKHLLSVLILPIIAVTYSRASYMAYLFGLLLILIRSKKKILLLLLLLIPLSIWISPRPWGEGVNLLRTFSIYSRIDSWMNGLSLFAQRPIAGWGFNTLSDINGQRIGIDNSYIFTLATTGLIGFISYVILLIKSLKQISKSLLFIPVLTILFHSFFNNSFFYIWINASFWLLIGLGDSSRDKV